MQITRISRQKSKKRVNVYLDGKFGFGTDLDTFVEFGLRVGQELTEDEVVKIKKLSNFQKTCDRLVRFATVRPRSLKEVIDWMRRKEIPKSNFDKLVQKLQNLGLLDDEKFARWWIDQRLEFRPRPVWVLRSELMSKGVEKKIIDKVLEERLVDEKVLAERLVRKKMRMFRTGDPKKAKEKVTAFLLRKGFKPDVVREAVGTFDDQE
jgi:regulatory protein